MNKFLKRFWVVLLILLATGLVILTFQPELNLADRYYQDFSLYMALILVFVSLFCEYVDSTLGMGYGTTLTPLLMIVGFSPLDIVPAILLCECIAGISAALMHQRYGNVSFARGSRAVRVAGVLAACSIVGTVTAVFLAVNIPVWLLKTYIGVLILSMGILIIAYRNGNLKFSWKRITGIGVLASFNKGISGGGYGPVVTSGQILSGMNEKNAVAITSLAEGVTCAVGLVLYAILRGGLEWQLALPLGIGALLSVPFAAWTVKIMHPQIIRASIGYFTLFLGILTLIKIAL